MTENVKCPKCGSPNAEKVWVKLQHRLIGVKWLPTRPATKGWGIWCGRCDTHTELPDGYQTVKSVS
jgi:hypothetical protein